MVYLCKSLALGHAHLKTTQGYLMTSQDEVIKEMQGWQGTFLNVQQPAKKSY